MAFLTDVTTREPAFHIGNIPVCGVTMLAPMDGYSDSPFRQITRSLGSAVSFTEFINAMEVVSKNSKYGKRCSYQEMERPVCIQLFDNDADRLLAAAKRIETLFHPDWIDINMGCSVSQVANRGAGVGLLKNPMLVGQVIDSLVRNLSVPVTAKIRLGWDTESVNYLEVGRILEESGAAAVALHARTGDQLFHGSADWDAIAQLKQALNIPVIGNGDIQTVADIRQMLDHTRCDGVMIGRAAIANPWIFAGYDIPDVPASLFKSTVFMHLKLMKDYHDPVRGCVVFRKYAKKYLTHLGVDKTAIRNLLTTVDPDQFTAKFHQLVDDYSVEPGELK